MKTFLIILSVAALAWAQERKECHCGLFVTTHAGEIEVHRLPAIDLESCEDVEACREGCKTEWDIIFENGGLDFTLPDHEHTIGQECCHILSQHGHEDFNSHELFGYFSVCGGPWVFEREHSGKDQLCCVDGHFPKHCDPVQLQKK